VNIRHFAHNIIDVFRKGKGLVSLVQGYKLAF